jgi:hypothetical protein
VQTPEKNEVTKAALVSLVLMGGFSVCAEISGHTEFYRALIHTRAFIFHEHKVSFP